MIISDILQLGNIGQQNRPNWRILQDNFWPASCSELELLQIKKGSFKKLCKFLFSVKKKMKPVAKVLNHRLLHLHIIIARTVGVVNDGFRKRCNDWSFIMYNLVNSRLWSSFWRLTDPRIVSIFLYLQYLKTYFIAYLCVFLIFLFCFLLNLLRRD